MNAPIAPEAAYAASAYRSNDIPVQPPHKWSQDDRETCREPRYWRDMDDATFKAKVREMTQRPASR